MERMQGFKFEIMPNGEQERKMRQFAGCIRFVYNKGLALQKSLYEAGEKRLSYATPWLADAPSNPQQQSL